LGEADGLFPVLYDATKPISFDFDADFIIHGASNATPDAYVKYPVDTMLSNILGIHQLLTFAKDHGVQKTVYISSSEVYGSAKRTAAIKEDEYGFTDILNVRSSYPMGKKAAETMCVSFAGQYGTPVSIVRPGHIYGPTATASDMRISSDFARKAAAGETLVMKSAGTQMRSYCHCLDCATAILTVLLKGECGQAYNISNKNAVINIRDMAALLAKAGGVQLVQEIPDSAAKAAFNPMDNSSLNAQRLEALGWEGVFDAEKGLSSTVHILRCIQ
jgi:nucleoside-diphosphate-sugar epimerase